jgi:hypothetical protein
MARCHACLFSTPGGEPLWIVSRHPRKFRLNANPAETFRKQAAPANHRTRYLVPSHRSGILDPISAPINLTPVETFLGAARLTRYFGLPRAEKNITRSSGARQSGSPPRRCAITHHTNAPRSSRSSARTTTRTSTIARSAATIWSQSRPGILNVH